MSRTLSYHHLWQTCPPPPFRESVVSVICDIIKAVLLTGREGYSSELNQNIWTYLHGLIGQHAGKWTISAATWCGRGPKELSQHCEEQHGVKDLSTPPLTAVRATLSCWLSLTALPVPAAGSDLCMSIHLSTEHTCCWVMLPKWLSWRQAKPEPTHWRMRRGWVYTGMCVSCPLEA